MTQIHSIDAEDAWDYIQEKQPFLLDVRSRMEFEGGTLPGAVNIPIHELHLRTDEVPHDREVVVFCAHGVRSGKGAHLLLGEGFAKVAHINGGLSEMNLE